jgi:hypothetical protein
VLELPDEPVDLELPEEPELPLPDDDGLCDAPVLACVEPGSRTATTPAVARLAAETAAVVLDSRRRPRSRSATARATADVRLRNSGVLMRNSLRTNLYGQFAANLKTL